MPQVLRGTTRQCLSTDGSDCPWGAISAQGLASGCSGCQLRPMHAHAGQSSGRASRERRPPGLPSCRCCDGGSAALLHQGPASSVDRPWPNMHLMNHSFHGQDSRPQCCVSSADWRRLTGQMLLPVANSRCPAVSCHVCTCCCYRQQRMRASSRRSPSSPKRQAS